MEGEASATRWPSGTGSPKALFSSRTLGSSKMYRLNSLEYCLQVEAIAQITQSPSAAHTHTHHPEVIAGPAKYRECRNTCEPGPRKYFDFLFFQVC